MTDAGLAAIEGLGAELAGTPADAIDRPEVWSRCARAGLTGLPVDRSLGGRSSTFTATADAFEAFAAAGAPPGLVFALGAQLWAVTMVIARFGSADQRQSWLPSLCCGTAIAGHAMTEPDSGSDAFAMRTTARAHGDQVTIDGAKTFVTNAPRADVFVVFATMDRSAGWSAVGAYLVERAAAGVTVGPTIRCMNPGGPPMAEVRFVNCTVPIANRIGTGASGMGIFTAAMELERSMLAAAQVGLVTRRLRAMAGDDISVVDRDHLARLWTRLYVSRWLVGRATARLDAGSKAPIEASLAKLSTSELWAATAAASVDAAGAAGLLSDGDDLGDSTAARIYSGTSEMQREIIGRWLGLR